MPTLLHLDSSPLEGSISRELTREFVKTWKNAHPDGMVIYRDLAANAPKPVDTSWIYSSYTPEANRTPEQKAVLAGSEEMIAELEAAVTRFCRYDRARRQGDRRSLSPCAPRWQVTPLRIGSFAPHPMLYTAKRSEIAFGPSCDIL